MKKAILLIFQENTLLAMMMKKAYLRGVFYHVVALDPKKSRYHLELLIDDYEYSYLLMI